MAGERALLVFCLFDGRKVEGERAQDQGRDSWLVDDVHSTIDLDEEHAIIRRKS